MESHREIQAKSLKLNRKWMLQYTMVTAVFQQIWKSENHYYSAFNSFKIQTLGMGSSDFRFSMSKNHCT